MEGAPDAELLMQLNDDVRAHMRHAVRQTVTGFIYAEDVGIAHEIALRADRAAAALTTEGWDEVLSVGLEASSTDHRDQSVGISPLPPLPLRRVFIHVAVCLPAQRH